MVILSSLFLSGFDNCSLHPSFAMASYYVKRKEKNMTEWGLYLILNLLHTSIFKWDYYYTHSCQKISAKSPLWKNSVNFCCVEEHGSCKISACPVQKCKETYHTLFIVRKLILCHNFYRCHGKVSCYLRLYRIFLLHPGLHM